MDTAQQQQPESPHSPQAIALAKRLFAEYFWFLVKNIIGWSLMILAWPLGLFFPGPGGLPVFLIGFALVTFPGKRSLTARVLRGRPVTLQQRRLTWAVLVFAVAAPPLAIWFLTAQEYSWAIDIAGRPLWLSLAYAIGFFVAWILGRLTLKALNVLLRFTPAVRRKIRPWLRRKGIHLLPPRRRRRRHGHADIKDASPDEEILEIDERHHKRIRVFWETSKPWLKRGVGIAFTIFVFAWLFRRIAGQWERIHDEVMRTSIWQFLAACALFAAFLLAFRMVTWWRIMAGLGHRLPFGAALRIWSTSELARYIGSGLSQMVGRVILCKPYGVDSGTTSASQLLELVLFLLANILVGVGCLAWLGVKVDGPALTWFFVAIALVPLLLGLLHPRVFYGLLNRVLRKLRKPEVTARLPARELFALLGWNVLGLFVQGWAIWLVTHKSLDLQPSHWWVVTGAYCLAWVAGFIAVWASAGIGVREPVFAYAAYKALPASVHETLKTDAGELLMFLSILLRLWATVGELLLAIVAYFLDYRGALGDHRTPDRPHPPAAKSITSPASH